MTGQPRSRSWHHQVASTVFITLAIIGCQSAARRVSGTKPTDRPEPVPTEDRVPLPLALAFRYNVGTYRYDIQTQATVSRRDSSQNGHSVQAHIGLSLSIQRETDTTLRIQVRIESAVFQADSTIPARGVRAIRPQSDTTSSVKRDTAGILTADTALAFDAVARADGELITVRELEAGCTTQVSHLAPVGTALLIHLPDTLRVGIPWQDTTSAVTCYGGLPATATAVQTYEVEAIELGRMGAPIARISRAATLSITGAGSRTGRSMSLTAAGSETATLVLDPTVGVIQSARSDWSLTITISTGTQEVAFDQRGHREIELKQ